MKPQRNTIRIGLLAERFGVSPESLRVWERQGLIPPAHRTPGGHRRYGAVHVRALRALIFDARALHPQASKRPHSRRSCCGYPPTSWP